MKNYESLADALADLKSRGYESDFEAETFCLYCRDLDLRLNPDEFQVDEMYRFEENSSPKDNIMLLAISSSTGVKGTLVDSHALLLRIRILKLLKKYNCIMHKQQ